MTTETSSHPHTITKSSKNLRKKSLQFTQNSRNENETIEVKQKQR